MAVPVAGLAWYATGRDENWVDTLVAAQLPEGEREPAQTARLLVLPACQPGRQANLWGFPAASVCVCRRAGSCRINGRVWLNPPLAPPPCPTAAADVGDACLPPRTLLADGSRVVGCWRGAAVLARPYPVAKGGPLGWDIQREEMEQCAERLAGGGGLVVLRRSDAGWQPETSPPDAEQLGIACPDLDFFRSRTGRYQ